MGVPTNLNDFTAADIAQRALVVHLKNVPVDHVPEATTAYIFKTRVTPYSFMTQGDPRPFTSDHRGGRGGRARSHQYEVRNVVIIFPRPPFEDQDVPLPPLGKVAYGSRERTCRVDARLDYTWIGRRREASTIGYLGGLSGSTQIGQLEGAAYLYLVEQFRARRRNPFSFAIIFRRARDRIFDRNGKSTTPLIRVLVHCNIQDADHRATTNLIKELLTSFSYGGSPLKIYAYRGAVKLANRLARSGIHEARNNKRFSRQVWFSVGHDEGDLTDIDDRMFNLCLVNEHLRAAGLEPALCVIISRGRTQYGRKHGYVQCASLTARDAILAYKINGYDAATSALFGEQIADGIELKVQKPNDTGGPADARSDAGTLYTVNSAHDAPADFDVTDLDAFTFDEDELQQVRETLDDEDAEPAKMNISPLPSSPPLQQHDADSPSLRAENLRLRDSVASLTKELQLLQARLRAVELHTDVTPPEHGHEEHKLPADGADDAPPPPTTFVNTHRSKRSYVDVNITRPSTPPAKNRGARGTP